MRKKLQIQRVGVIEVDGLTVLWGHMRQVTVVSINRQHRNSIWPSDALSALASVDLPLLTLPRSRGLDSFSHHTVYRALPRKINASVLRLERFTYAALFPCGVDLGAALLPSRVRRIVRHTHRRHQFPHQQTLLQTR